MLRFTPDEFAALQSRIKAGVQRKSAAPAQVEPTAKAVKSTGRRNKYGAQATEVHGIRFDSKAEAKRYLQLKALEQAGEISDLQLQVKFDLLPAQELDGKKERPVQYIADFTYRDKAGSTVVEDAKSAATKTKEFVLKRKMMLFFHGIVIREVLMD